MEIVHGMPVVSSLTNEEITLSAGETSPRWLLQQGSDFIIETNDFGAAVAKAKDLIPVSGPTP